MSDQILVCGTITGIRYHFEEAMPKSVLEIFAAQHKEVDNRLSSALESLMEHFVEQVLSSPETIPQSSESIIDNPGLFTTKAILVKIWTTKVHWRERAIIEDRFRKYARAGIKLDPIAVSHPSKLGKKPPTNIYDHIKASLKTFSMVT